MSVVVTLQQLAIGANVFSGRDVRMEAKLTTRGVLLHASRTDGTECEAQELPWDVLDAADSQLADRECRRLLVKLRTAGQD